MRRQAYGTVHLDVVLNCSRPGVSAELVFTQQQVYGIVHVNVQFTDNRLGLRLGFGFRLLVLLEHHGAECTR